MDIQNSVIVVTGGLGFFGQSIASSLRLKGAKVLLLDKIDSDIEDYYQADLTIEAEVESVIQDIVVKYGRINVLINNAGFIFSEPLINLFNPSSMRHNYASFDICVRANLHTTFLTGAIVIEQMIKKRTKGVVINISSISAEGNAGQTAYSAAKAGVIALTKTWAKELGPFGIRSVAISPGFINTESTSKSLSPEILNYVKKSTPLRKLGDVSEISKSVIFAIENDFLTGTVLKIDGGLTI